MKGAGMRRSFSRFTAMSLTALLACAAAVMAVVVALASAAVASQAQEVPSCFGAPATIVGTEGDDTIVGTPQADVIVGLGGTDNIRGRAGGDRICGGPNPDLSSPPAEEYLYGGRGKDRLAGGGGQDYITGDIRGCRPISGDDILLGGPGFDTLEEANAGCFDTTFPPDVDKLYGGSTDDRLYADDGDYLDFLDGGEHDFSVFGQGDFCFGDLAADGTAQDTEVNCEWGPPRS
jgi:Ca2+-binding RTX toxin-like protein